MPTTLAGTKLSNYGKPLCEFNYDETHILLAYAHGIVMLYRGYYPSYYEKGGEKFNELHQELAELYEQSHDTSKYISGPFHTCKSWEQWVTEDSLSVIISEDQLNKFPEYKRETVIIHSDKCNELRDVLLLWAGVDKYAENHIDTHAT